MRPALLIQTIAGLMLFLFSGNSVAQVYHKAKTITTREGLSDNRVTCFYKDSRGFMWIGTRNGLNRYNGHSFEIYKPSAGNSISNENINDIGEDRDGRLWVATMEGLNSFDLSTGKWEVLMPVPDSWQQGIPSYIIWSIHIDKNNLVWIVSDNNNFSSYNISTGKFLHYDWRGFTRSHPAFQHTRYNSIHKLVRKNDHVFWLGTTQGLVSLDIQTQLFSFHGGGYYADVHDMKYDAEAKKVFLSVEKGKFFSYDEATTTMKEQLPVPFPYPSTHFEMSGDDEIWMASGMGLLKINDNREAIRLEKNIPQLTGSLLPGSVQAVFEDDDQLRWVGTANGISLYDPAVNSSAFLPLVNKPDKEGMNRMGAVYYDDISENYFVCSGEPAAVFIISKKTGSIEQRTRDATGRNFSYCMLISRDKNGNLWLLTGNHVYRYNRANGQFILFPTPSIGDNVVFRAMLHDHEGNYWFGSFHQGLFYYRTGEKKFVSPPDTGLQDFTSITGFASIAAENKILFSTFGWAPHSIDLATGKTTGYYQTDAMKEYAQLELVNSMHQDASGGIWLATHGGGLFRYNPGMPYEKAFTRFDMKKGLSTNNIFSVCSNGDSVLWMLSGKGISAMTTSGHFLYDLDDRQLFSFSSYGSETRYPQPIYYNPAGNELLLSVGGGLLFYYPGKEKKSLQFPLVITRVNLNGRDISPEKAAAVPDLQLSYRSNSVIVEFAALYYGNRSGLEFEYRLEGYEQEWEKAGNDFKAVYRNLSPGHYVFHARVKRKSGEVVAAVSGFTVRIIPPFWMRWWFITLLVVLSVLTVWLMIRSLRLKLKEERMINVFATSLYGQKTTEDIFWDTAKNCIGKLGFIDCVIYQKDENRNVLLQKAAYGPKNPHRREIVNLIEIPVGKGIVGTVAQNGKAIRVNDTSADPRYIVDDDRRLSEIAVPVFVDGKVFAVIDSEHPRKRFYTRLHLRALKKIAAICSERIAKYITEERLRAKIARDLHDEMGSTLTSINIISKVAMEQKLPEERTNQYLQKIKDHSGRMMESMSDMVWAINPVNDNFEKVILRMKEFAAEILEPAGIHYFFSDEGLSGDIHLNPGQRKNIYLIFKEALNNVVKYSRAAEVNIVFKREGNTVRMLIADNGDGFDTRADNSGNGLKNMHVRAAEMGAEIKLESIPGTGTSVVLELPVT